MEKTIAAPLTATNYRSYIIAFVFITGNVLLPLAFHAIPRGGLTFLPIYFFTLIAAYRYGLVAGLLTAIFSPLASHILYGMPPEAVLPLLLIKGIFLALAATWAASYFKKVNILILLGVVLSYQLAGSIAEYFILGDFYKASQDFRIGIPGMVLQVAGGYLILKLLSRKNEL